MKNSSILIPPNPPATAVIRVDTDGWVWLLARKDRGWGEFGFQYSCWAHVGLAWNIQPSEAKQDAAGTYYEARVA